MRIPVGLIIGKKGTRGITALSIAGFSFFAFLIGSVKTMPQIVMARLGSGFAEAPGPQV